MLNLRDKKNLKVINDTINHLLDLYGTVSTRLWRKAFLNIDVELYDKLMLLFLTTKAAKARCSDSYNTCVVNNTILITLFDSTDRKNSKKYRKKLAKYLIRDEARPYTPYKSASIPNGLRYLNTFTEDNFPEEMFGADLYFEWD